MARCGSRVRWQEELGDGGRAEEVRSDGSRWWRREDEDRRRKGGQPLVVSCLDPIRDGDVGGQRRQSTKTVAGEGGCFSWSPSKMADEFGRELQVAVSQGQEANFSWSWLTRWPEKLLTGGASGVAVWRGRRWVRWLVTNVVLGLVEFSARDHCDASFCWCLGRSRICLAGCGKLSNDNPLLLFGSSIGVAVQLVSWHVFWVGVLGESELLVK
uniref:Uncharacterized protein n=1 Tax=Oryza barthii TaxID=65489 RepID=A0A0D3F2T5_9ORYZ